jgi:dUTPase
MSSFKSVSEYDLKVRLEQPRYMIVFKPLDEELYASFEKEYPEENAGVDLYCREDVEIAPGQMAMLKLGLAAKMIGPEYGEDRMFPGRCYHYWLLPRSSISKKGLIMANSVGVIDKSYRGELMGAVVNVRGEPVKVARGERLFQIVAPDMGYILKAVKAREYDNNAAEEEYLMKEMAFSDALREFVWPREVSHPVFLNSKQRVEWLEKNDWTSFQKLYKLQSEANDAAGRRPSVAARLREIPYGKWVGIVDGGVIGPFETMPDLDKAIEGVSFKNIPFKITKFKAIQQYLTLFVMDDTSRGAGGFGSTGS